LDIFTIEIFNNNPELASIGTPEEYSDYLDSIFPDSKVKDIVYHGTKAYSPSGAEKPKFETFDKSFIGKGQGLRSDDMAKGFYFGSYNIADKTGTRVIPAILDIQEVNDTTVRRDTVDFDTKGDVFVVEEPEQIHILGSKQDIQKFKEYSDWLNQYVQTPVETTMSKLDGLQEISKESSLATIETKAGEESVYKLRGQILERQSNYVTRKLGVEYNGIRYYVDFENGIITNLKTGKILKGGVTSPIGMAVVDEAIKQSEAKPAMKAGASVGNFVDNVGRDIFDGAKVKTLEEYVKEADEQNKENGFKLNNVTQKEFDLLVDHLTAIKNSLPNMKFVSKELFLNANFTEEQKALLKKDGIGGTLDLLGVDSDGKLHIIDFKNKIFNPEKEQFWDSNLYNDGKFDSKLTVWSRQLSIYKEMLEQKGFEVATTSILLVPTEYSYDTEGNIEFGKFHSPNSVGKPIPEEHQSNLSSELINVPENQEMIEQFKKDTVPNIQNTGKKITVSNNRTLTVLDDNINPPYIGYAIEVLHKGSKYIMDIYSDGEVIEPQVIKEGLTEDVKSNHPAAQFNKKDVAAIFSDSKTESKEDLPKPPSIEEIQNEDESVVQVFRISQVKGFRVEVRKEIVDGETVYQAYAVEDVLIENVDKEIASTFKEEKSILAEPASTQEEAVALAKSKISRFDVQGLLLSLNNACK